MSSKPIKRRPTRQLGIEGLESRTMMAGNVLVEVTDGVLHVTGDAASNDVQIRQLKQTFTGAWPGAKLEISGNYFNRNNTLINGQSEPIVVEGVKSGAVIALGNGNNALRIANLPQDDTVPVQRQVNLSGDVSITTGSGNDDIRLYLNNGKSVNITSGQGEDYIQLTKPKVNDLTITTDPASNPGAITAWSKDYVQISRITAKGDVTIQGGERRDVVTLGGNSLFDGQFNVDLRGGGTGTGRERSNELLIMEGSSGFNAADSPIFNGPVVVVGGAGNDGVVFGSCLINGSTNVSLGSGNDGFQFKGVSSVELFVAAELGNDSFSIRGTSSAVHLDGGGGFDKLRRGPDADLGEETLISIEEDVTELS